MRADRLVSLVLLLRQRSRLTATEIATELEVSTRTVLRDIEALSAAGVPVYADRGRHGGFALLPGFRTELTGLTDDEALALLAAGADCAGQVFGLGPALASAMRKVVDALPTGHRSGDAAQRILIEPPTDLLARQLTPEPVSATTMSEVRRAVVVGRRLRIHYASFDQPPRWRTVDPVGLVTVRAQSYLLALHNGADRTYRLTRIHDAEPLPEPAQRPAEVDLPRLWRERSARFLAASDQLVVRLLLDPSCRNELVATALTVREGRPELDGRIRLDATFQDRRHAEWALWQLGPAAEVVTPVELRASVGQRAAAFAARYAPVVST